MGYAFKRDTTYDEDYPTRDGMEKSGMDLRCPRCANFMWRDIKGSRTYVCPLCKKSIYIGCI